MLFKKKIVFLMMPIILALLISGCGKLGEKEVNDILKNKYKSNLVSSGYSIDEKYNLAQAHLKLKNAYTGKEYERIEYFYVKNTNNKVIVKPINTYGIPRESLEQIAIEMPERFREYVNQYHELDNLKSECESVVSEYEDKYFNQLDGWVENWFLYEAIDAAGPVNDKIEEYRDAYENAPKIINKHFDYPPEYFYISLDSKHYYTNRTNEKP